MKIDLSSIDRSSFYVNEHIWNGQVMNLVIPKEIGCKWTRENKIFRSSVWDYDGNLVSASFPKFVNWGESPEVFPVPTSLKNASIVEKLDGSTLILSKYMGNYMIRTRGTIDATNMEKNGHEIEIFKNEILPLFESKHATPETWDHSFIFEWTSPLNTIVINYGDKPTFSIIGIIRHYDYSLFTQFDLDIWSKKYNIKRPTIYTFTTIEDLLSAVKMWEGKEGVCVYHKDGQEIHKVKSAWYLMLHHMKSELSSLEKVIDVWTARNYPSYQDFYNYIVTTFDYELAEQCRGHISNICDAYKEVQQIVAHMKAFVTPLKTISRKDAALKIIAAYGETNRKSFCFQLLDGKELDSEAIKKLIFQVLKK